MGSHNAAAKSLDKLDNNKIYLAFLKHTETWYNIITVLFRVSYMSYGPVFQTYTILLDKNWISRVKMSIVFSKSLEKLQSTATSKKWLNYPKTHTHTTMEITYY